MRIPWYICLICNPIGAPVWVRVEGSNPEPSAGLRFWTRTQPKPGLGPGWVRVRLGSAEAYSHLKLVTVEEMILFLCATRVDLRENEVGQLEQVFEIEVVREKWNEYSEGLEINMIGNTE